MRSRARRARRERQRQADRARPDARLRARARNLEAVIAAAEPTNLRADRHGGLVDDRRDARALSRSRDEGIDNVGVVLQAALKRTVADAGLARRGERAPLQGDLRRAGERSSSATTDESAPASSRTLDDAARGRLLRRRSRRTTSGSSSARSAKFASVGCRRTGTSSRCCSACVGARRPARRGRAPPAHLRPVRPPVVRVLAAASAGEPEGRRLRRRRSRPLARSRCR